MVGLANVHGSCYLNSILQMLFHCEEFRRSVLDHDVSSNAPEAALRSLFLDMAESADDCSPAAVQSAFSTVLDQNDASDAFFTIIGAIKSHFFDTRIRTELSWDGGSRTAFDPPSPAVVVFSREFTSLSECVRGFGEPRFIDEYSIDGIPRRVSVVRTFAEVPRVLVLQLSRFGRGCVCAEQPITPDERLEMQINGATVEFRLSAVIVQIGGHYRAMIEKEGEWFEISDVQIRRMSAARSE
jgi:uncharacterized UBP type Zn finger protein